MAGMISDFKTLVREAGLRGPKRVAVILPHESASLEGIHSARREGLAEGIMILIDKTLLLMVWSIWGMYLPVKGHFHRKIRVGYTVCGSAAVLQSPVALFLRNLHVGEAI